MDCSKVSPEFQQVAKPCLSPGNSLYTLVGIEDGVSRKFPLDLTERELEWVVESVAKFNSFGRSPVKPLQGVKFKGETKVSSFFFSKSVICSLESLENKFDPFDVKCTQYFYTLFPFKITFAMTVKDQ